MGRRGEEWAVSVVELYTTCVLCAALLDHHLSGTRSVNGRVRERSNFLEKTVT